MLDTLQHRRRWILAVVAIALIVAAFALSSPGSATTARPTGGDGLYNEGIVCFSVGQQVSVIAVGGPVGYNITPGTLGFATLQGFGGNGVLVRNVVLAAGSDRVKVILTQPATREVCAAWHITEQEFFG